MGDPTKTNSPAKLMTIAFIKLPDNSELVFTITGGVAEADKFVQHMRTELSRLRAIIRQNGRHPKRFRLQKRAVTALDDGTVRIVLYKDSAAEHIAQDLSLLFPELVSNIDGT